ncbi:MAG TPA: addiction module protein [Gemmatimonadales bacterium]|nr:addiction module protein [Gemmatimonadales bacterium]
MTPKTIMDEISRLPLEERLRLVEDIWDGIAATPEAVPIPDWHRAELDRRLDDPSAAPSLPWEEVLERLRRQE